MTIDEALETLKDTRAGLYCAADGNPTIYAEALEMAIKALEQEPYEDCISRAWLKEAIHNFYYGLKHTPTEEDIQAYIDAAPSVTPQPKTGRWEWVQYDGNPNIGNWHCSECRTIIPHMPEETDNTPIYKWCPMCGAKMEVSE